MKQKRKFKNGDQRLTPFGHALIGVSLSLCLGIFSAVIAATVLSGAIAVFLLVYWGCQVFLTIVGGLIYCLEASDPKYASIQHFADWETIVLTMVSWPFSLVFLLWKTLSPSMFEEVK